MLNWHVIILFGKGSAAFFNFARCVNIDFCCNLCLGFMNIHNDFSSLNIFLFPMEGVLVGFVLRRLNSIDSVKYTLHV